jgi:hypothetical protein
MNWAGHSLVCPRLGLALAGMAVAAKLLDFPWAGLTNNWSGHVLGHGLFWSWSFLAIGLSGHVLGWPCFGLAMGWNGLRRGPGLAGHAAGLHVAWLGWAWRWA